MKARQAKKLLNKGLASIAFNSRVNDAAMVKGKIAYDRISGEILGDIREGSLVRSIWIRGEEGKRAHKGWTAQCSLYNEYWEGIN